MTTLRSETCPHCGALNRHVLMITHIQAVVAAHYGLSLLEMQSRRAAWSVSHPRQEAMYLARELTGQSLPEIGRRFGDRDHTTVMFAIRQVKHRISVDTEVAENIGIMREKVLAYSQAIHRRNFYRVADKAKVEA